MQVKLLTLGVTALAAVAWAQSSQDPDRTQDRANPNRTQESTDSNRTQDRTETQTQTTTGKQTTSQTEKSMPTKTFKGMLVDANCKGSAGADRSSTTTMRESTTANRTETDRAADKTESSSTTHHETTTTGRSADRSGSEQGSAAMNRSKTEWQSCPVTSNTTDFGLVLADGRFMKFDMVGNSRASDTLKNRPKWTSGSKPPNVTVRGSMEGDKLIVSEIK